MLSYAEDETEVEGTVNGVTSTSAGKAATTRKASQSLGGARFRSTLGSALVGSMTEGRCEPGAASYWPLGLALCVWR